MKIIQGAYERWNRHMTQSETHTTHTEATSIYLPLNVATYQSST